MNVSKFFFSGMQLFEFLNLIVLIFQHAFQLSGDSLFTNNFSDVTRHFWAKVATRTNERRRKLVPFKLKFTWLKCWLRNIIDKIQAGGFLGPHRYFRWPILGLDFIDVIIYLEGAISKRNAAMNKTTTRYWSYWADDFQLVSISAWIWF